MKPCDALATERPTRVNEKFDFMETSGSRNGKKPPSAISRVVEAAQSASVSRAVAARRATQRAPERGPRSLTKVTGMRLRPLSFPLPCSAIVLRQFGSNTTIVARRANGCGPAEDRLAASDHDSLQRRTDGRGAVMWRSIYFWMGVVLARYLFRRRNVQIDLEQLRKAGM